MKIRENYFAYRLSSVSGPQHEVTPLCTRQANLPVDLSHSDHARHPASQASPAIPWPCHGGERVVHNSSPPTIDGNSGTRAGVVGYSSKTVTTSIDSLRTLSTPHEMYRSLWFIPSQIPLTGDTPAQSMTFD